MKNLPFILIAVFLFTSCTSRKMYSDSEQYSPEDDKFIDSNFPNSEKSLWSLIKWGLFSTRETWPKWIDIKPQPKLITPSKNQVNITLINHSTFFLQFEDMNILTDPIWSERTSPVQWAGPKRVHKPGLNMDELNKVDVVIISHNHYDHLDTASLEKLEALYSPLFIVPLGDKELLTSLGIEKVVELDWWEELDFNENKITFTPNQHWSKRGLFDHNKSLWGGYVISVKGKQVYFAGDTGYTKYFKDIFTKFGAMELSLLPIGAYEPRWFMQAFHMDPEEAIWAHKDLQSKKSIGTHYGTFQLTNEARKDPQRKLKMYMPSNGLKPEDFITIEPGVSELFSL